MNFEVHIRVMSFLARQAVKLWELMDRTSPLGLSSCLRCLQAELTAALWTAWTGATAVMEKKSVSLSFEQ